MFLCISSNYKDWNLNKELLLLGSWCKNNKNNLSKLNYKLLPYHWEDAFKFDKDLKYLFQLYKDIIPEISIILNEKNNKNFSSKYWELLIGPWLWQFTQILFDRYSSITQAVERFDNLETWITDTIYSPRTFQEFDSLVQNDDYNFIICSKIITNLNLTINISNRVNIKYLKEENIKSDNDIIIKNY